VSEAQHSDPCQDLATKVNVFVSGSRLACYSSLRTMTYGEFGTGPVIIARRGYLITERRLPCVQFLLE
jgi:hypothetical protein